MPFRAIDLFCGCGGLTCGFVQEGFEVIASVDINSVALKTYERNFPKTQVFNQDIRNIEPADLRRKLKLQRGDLDCLIGGPPCQGFSKNVPATKRFLEDPRNQLMKVFLSFVKEFQPKVVLIENVAEIINAFNGAVSDEVLSELGIEYSAKLDVLNAKDYGVPQSRRRAFFLAGRIKEINFPKPIYSHEKKTVKRGKIRALATLSNDIQLPLFDEVDDEFRRPLFDRLEHLPQKPYVSVWEAIGDLPRLINPGMGENPCDYHLEPETEYQVEMRSSQPFTQAEVKLYDHVARKLSPIQFQRISSLGLGQSMSDLPEELRARKGYSGAYGRLKPNDTANTITKWVFHPGSGRFAHPYDNRVITIREAARLQSFPDWFVFEGTYIQKSHQVGEAVPSLLVRHLAASIANNLGR